MFARHRNQEPDLVQEQESPTADSEAGDEHMPSFEVKHDSRLSRGISRARAYAAARPKRHFVGAFAVLLGVVILLLPSPYVIEMPGPTQDVLGKVEDGAVIDITGTGVTTYKDSGKLLLTTVNASGVPGYPIINAQAVWGWSNPQVEVMPREATVPVGQSADQYQKKVEQDMAGSQDSASAVGLAYAKAHADELGIDASALQHAKVTMHVDSIGGPSAGMMYTLGLIDKHPRQRERRQDHRRHRHHRQGRQSRQNRRHRAEDAWLQARWRHMVPGPRVELFGCGRPRAGWSARRQGRHAGRGVSGVGGHRQGAGRRFASLRGLTCAASRCF
jgi:PDZ domain-containing protein